MMTRVVADCLKSSLVWTSALVSSISVCLPWLVLFSTSDQDRPAVSTRFYCIAKIPVLTICNQQY